MRCTDVPMWQFKQIKCYGLIVNNNNSGLALRPDRWFPTQPHSARTKAALTTNTTSIIINNKRRPHCSGRRSSFPRHNKLLRLRIPIPCRLPPVGEEGSRWLRLLQFEVLTSPLLLHLHLLPITRRTTTGRGPSLWNRRSLCRLRHHRSLLLLLLLLRLLFLLPGRCTSAATVQSLGCRRRCSTTRRSIVRSIRTILSLATTTTEDRPLWYCSHSSSSGGVELLLLRLRRTCREKSSPPRSS